MVIVGVKYHPSYIEGERPPSRISEITWPAFPHTPKNDWVLWSHFLHIHITPMMTSMTDLR